MSYVYRRPLSIEIARARLRRARRNVGDWHTVNWNPVDKNSDIVLSNNNLTAYNVSVDNVSVRATRSRGVGYYFEVTIGAFNSASAGWSGVGVSNLSESVNNYTGVDTNGIAYFGQSGIIIYNNVGVVGVSNFNTGDVIGIEVNSSGINFYKNGSLQYTATTFPSGNLYPALSLSNGDIFTANFGASPLKYLPYGVLSWDETQTGFASFSSIAVTSSLVASAFLNTFPNSSLSDSVSNPSTSKLDAVNQLTLPDTAGETATSFNAMSAASSLGVTSTISDVSLLSIFVALSLSDTATNPATVKLDAKGLATLAVTSSLIDSGLITTHRQLHWLLLVALRIQA